MADADPLHSYLNLADELFHGRIAETETAVFTVALPPLDQPLLHPLAQQAETFSTTSPRRGWAVAQIAYSAAVAQKGDAFLRSMAAWYLARACNHWVQPKRAREAASIARAGFEWLAERGWVAACDWQINALAWTQPNFADAAQVLEDALHILQKHELEAFIPDCRLALSFAQILIGKHEQAFENIRLSEQTYIDHQDPVNQARCWLNQASSLRRQGRFGEALEKLRAALTVFLEHNALTDQAKAHYQIAVGHMLQTNQLPEAVDHFEKAVGLFEATELELWRAMSINNLGAVYMINGELKRAEGHYQEARIAFASHAIMGLLADNLNDSGKLHVLMGRPDESVEELKQSVRLNEELGAQLSRAVAMSNLGEAYGQLGRYQDALHHLEQAVDALAEHKAYFRMATCEKYMAAIWSRLGQPDQAHNFLDRSASHYEMAEQHGWLSSVHNYRAAAFFQQGNPTEALQSLERSLDIAKTYQLRPQYALALRLLGDSLIEGPRHTEAVDHLTAAQAEFLEMGMSMEQAACLVSMGSYHAVNTATEDATRSFEEALQISERSFPEIDWRAHMELGNLAALQRNDPLALEHFRRGVEALNTIRSNFLQPALAGSYLFHPSSLFDRVVSFAVKAGAVEDALRFVEASKASTVLRHLTGGTSYATSPGSQELNELREEIEQLKNQLRVSPSEVHPLQSAVQMRQVREELKRKSQGFDALKSRLERQNQHTISAAGLPSFDLTRFRQAAGTYLAGSWAALHYFLMEEQLVVVLLTAEEVRMHAQPVSARFEMALAACDRARRRAEPLLQSDLEVLGAALIPAFLAGALTPETNLLIVPHRRLHQVPWPALRPAPGKQPLVSLCIPAIVPSLLSLELLWERSASSQHTDRNAGVLIGLSSFGGRHPELPSVRDEVQALADMFDSGCQRLLEQDATWQNLWKLRNESGYSRFGWMHIASHFFSDRQTGRLSRIALRDDDIVLDQLRDLTPLPRLVSLSACNSNDSFLFEGDERIDLQTTCFIAGTDSVIGSAWPVLDRSGAAVMVRFYKHYLSGRSPAQAMVLAQRESIQSGEPPETWASFICAGMP